MNDFLVWLGTVTLIVIASFLFAAIYSELRELIDRCRYNYRVKHRFDKPPTAKCYCIDCKYHCNETRRCYRFTETRHTADNWFCWEATPRKEENK